MKKKGFFKTLLLSNCLILMISLIVAMIGYFGYRGNILKYTSDYNMVLLNQIRNIMDERVRSINNLIFSISVNPSVENLRITSNPEDNNNRYNAIQAMKALESYLAVYKYVDSLYLYFEKNDLIITNSSVYSSTQKFLDYSDTAYWEEASWRDLFQKTRYISYSNSKNMSTQGGEKNLFTITYCLYSKTSDSKAVYIILNLDYSFLENFKNDAKFFPDSLLIAKDPSGNTMFSLGEGSKLYEEGLTDISFTQNTQLLGPKGQRLIATKLSSTLNEWDYFFVLPENLFVQKATDIFIFSALLLIILAGLVLAYLLAKHNFVPIRNITLKISHYKQTGLETSNGDNEIEYITQAVTQSFEEFKQIESQLTKQIPIVQMHTVRNLINGNYNDLEKLIRFCSSVGITFPYPFYYVVIYSFDSQSIQMDDLSLATAQLRNEAFTSVMDGFIIHTTDINESYTVLGLINTSVDLYKNKELFEAYCREVLKKINLSAHITISLGSQELNLKEVRKSYLSADRALQNYLMRLTGGIIYAGSMEPDKNAYYYPMDLEMQLVNYVKCGKIDEVNAILDLIIMENFIKNELSLESARCLMFSMMGTAIRLINSSGVSKNGVFEQSALINKIISCNNAQAMEEALRKVYSMLCQAIQAEKKKKADNVIQLIVNYIANHYSDNSLSLLSVSNEIGLNPTYLSGYFKEQTGMNFLVYVNKIRLDKAQEKLRQTDKSISEIAADTGYSNSGVLIRNFKKYLGITPGQFREQLGKNACE